MENIYNYFLEKGEPFLAGFFENREKNNFYRFANSYKRFFEYSTMPEYSGGSLYPQGKRYPCNCTVLPHIALTYCDITDRFHAKFPEEYVKLCENEMFYDHTPDTIHTVGGWGFVHSFPNYERIEREGLDSYRERVLNLPDDDFKEGLLLILDGIKAYHNRSLEMLKIKEAPQKLIDALEKVPFSPAETLYEALVCRNFIFYIDGCDDPGRLDAELYQYYKGEDVTDIISEFFDNVDINNGWTASLGPEYNELTVQVLRACVGHRRPSVELRVTDNMPDHIWKEALLAVKSGCGSPNFYNEKLYQEKLEEKFPHIPKEDLLKFTGGGCTETMLTGVSRVGSIDAGINTAYVLRNTITNYLTKAKTFDEFYEQLFLDIDIAIKETLSDLDKLYHARINYIPHPIRTLLVDDCIDNRLDFNAGGARYNWSIINFAGMINVIDSLLAIKQLIFDNKEYTNEEFLHLLDAEDEEFFKRLKECEFYGVDNHNADYMAEKFTDRLFDMLDKYKPVFGDCYLPASIQFNTYTEAGKIVGPTPDGRKNGEPLCDSLSAIHGNDIKGPTALLNSVTKIKLSKALGTPVLNLMISPDHVEPALRPLIEGYFDMGGMQMQITCTSKAVLLDALEHPENHRNLIVRVGGFSEYFNNLSPEMKKSVIERTMF